MGNKLALPDDGNYTTWWDPLNDRVDKYCSDRAFAPASGHLGSTVFNGMFNEETAQKLEGFMTGATGMGTYLFSKGGMITMLVFGILLLLACIFLCFALMPDVKNWISKWCCGACKDRPRKRFEELDRGWKITIIGCAVIFIAGCLTLGITSIITATQTIKSTNAFACDAWLLVRGYYFGTNDSTKAEVPDIAWNWKGAMTQMDELQVIQTNVTPGDSNPLLLYINDLYYNQFQVSVNETTEKAQELNVRLNDTLYAMNLLHDQISNVTNPDYQAMIRMASVTMEKSIEFKEVMDQSINEGYGNMSESIDFYLGENSSLLNTAYNVSNNAITSVMDVNFGIGNLATSVDSLGTLLAALMKTTASFAIIIPIISFILCGVFIYLCVDLFSCYKKDQLPSDTSRKMLKLSYVGWCLLAGFSMLTAALTYTFGAIGTDVCYSSTEYMLKDGNWNMLHGLLEKTANGTVDFWSVLDTCVREDGDGDVASALGLTSSLTGLETLTNVAIANISSLPDKVLDPPEKKTLAQLMRVGYHDNLCFNYRQSMTDDGNGYFNDSHYVRPENEVGGYGSWDLLCLVPAYNMHVGGIISECATDFIYPVASMNQAVDILNQRVVATVSPLDATFPTGFCTPYVQQNMTETCPEGATMITSTLTVADLEAWQAQVATATNDTFGYSFYYTAIGLWEAEVMRNADTAQLIAADGSSATANVTCPGQTDANCLFGLVRDATLNEMGGLAPDLSAYVYEMLDTVTGFVDDPVLVTINSLLGSAKNALQNFNCQFAGTALNYGALNAVCEGAMPGMALMWVLFLVEFFVCLLAAWITWKNLHFVEDLAAGFTSDTEYAALSKQRNVEQQRAFQNSAIRTVYSGAVPEKYEMTDSETRTDSLTSAS